MTQGQRAVGKNLLVISEKSLVIICSYKSSLYCENIWGEWWGHSIFKGGHHRQYVGYFAQNKNVNFSTQNTMCVQYHRLLMYVNTTDFPLCDVPQNSRVCKYHRPPIYVKDHILPMCMIYHRLPMYVNTTDFPCVWIHLASTVRCLPSHWKTPNIQFIHVTPFKSLIFYCCLLMKRQM